MMHWAIRKDCTACISIGVYSTFVASLWVLIAASVIGHFFTDKYLLIALNGVVFGTCANAAGSGLAEAAASALGAGLGFTVCSLPGSRQKSMTSMSPRHSAASPCGYSPPVSFRWPSSHSSKRSPQLQNDLKQTCFRNGGRSVFMVRQASFTIVRVLLE